MTELSVPWADGDGSNQEEEGKIHRFSICMLTIMVESTDISSGSWVQRLHWNIHPAAPEIAGDHRIKADKGTQGPGRARGLPALAPKRGQEMGKEGILGWLPYLHDDCK